MVKINRDFIINQAPAPAKGNKIYYDDDLKGFGLRVTAKNAKAFVLNYYFAGIERRHTIGKSPAWTAEAARKEAAELIREIDRGFDPVEERKLQRTAPTVEDLYQVYLTDHIPTKRERSGKDDISMWKNYILPRLGRKKVADVSHDDADGLHREISTTKKPRANRVLEVFKKSMNIAIRKKWIVQNPVDGLAWNQENQRTRYLSVEETERFVSALNQHPNIAACRAIKLVILTGARKMEVLGARWEMFDLTAGYWTKPAAYTKQKKEHRAPLSPFALNILLEIKKEPEADPVFVFPGKGKNGHSTDFRRTWNDIRATAKIKDVKVHDLRHTYASVLASAGVSLPIVGALIGHTQAQSTKRYMQFYDEPLRDATAAAGKKIGF